MLLRVNDSNVYRGFESNLKLSVYAENIWLQTELCMSVLIVIHFMIEINFRNRAELMMPWKRENYEFRSRV